MVNNVEHKGLTTRNNTSNTAIYLLRLDQGDRVWIELQEGSLNANDASFSGWMMESGGRLIQFICFENTDKY